MKNKAWNLGYLNMQTGENTPVGKAFGEIEIAYNSMKKVESGLQGVDEQEYPDEEMELD